MQIQKLNPRSVAVLLIILVVATLRVINNFSPELTSLANFSPLAALAIFGGAKFKKTSTSLLFPIGAILISDLVLFATVYKKYSDGFLYQGWYWVYGAFLLIALMSRLVNKNQNIKTVSISILGAVFIHWIVTDLGVWLGSNHFPQTFAGFISCLTVAIPFELKLLAATIIYSGIMFGAMEWAKIKVVSMGNS
jgi:hypothetical protein